MSLKNPARSRYHIAFRLAAVLLLLLLWGFVASDRIPASISSAAHAQSELAGDKGAKPEHDLSALRVFSRVVLLIRDNYFDPKRIEPRKMLVAALDNVERQVAEIMVEGDEKSPALKVTVNKVTKEFNISGVDTFWNVSFALKEIFDFVNKNLSPSSREDTREIEYAAVNGMLSTLDPHSILLKPEFNKEMKLQTKGEFGGLGFVIQMKESNLTVVKVLKGTPAARAGIHNKDQIIRIGKESTVNMDVNEAVSRLRGKPGSEVTITVTRSGWTAPRPMTLTRANISVESVAGRLLDHNVGYIRLKGFQGNTARDMYALLKRLKQEAATRVEQGKPGLKGLVLDLRGNPGGLLDQAIQVSDAFLSEGTIVTTVGLSDKLRDVKKARPDESDIRLPLAVLVNSGSASASEIVAGALKNLNRAVVIGRPSFGKGSVQVLYDFPDESALKLTIAQYLTPGDVSIQETGITPDIELLASQVTQERVDVFAPKKTMGEADLAGHLGNPNLDKVASKREDVVRRDKPVEELRYVREIPADKKANAAASSGKSKDKADRDDMELDDLDSEDPDTDEIVEDFQIRFARDLVTAAPYSTRDAMLKAAKPFIAQRRQEEADKIEKAIVSLGLDWGASDSKPLAAPKLVTEMKPLVAQKAAAGETLAWTVTAQNQGSAPFKRLHAYSESENPYLDRREFLFGTLAPGEKRSWTVNVKMPKDMVSRRDEVTVKFADQAGTKLDDLKGEISVVELPRPAFAFNWQVVDRCEKCNGDGMTQLGETVELVLEVKNIGQGKAFSTIGSLKNKADEYVSLSKGRANLGELLPGQSKTAVFEFEVKPEFKSDSASLQLAINDEATDVWVAEKIAVPVSQKGESGKPQQLAVRANSDLSIYAAANKSSSVIAQAKKGTIFSVDARFGDLWRVRLGQRAGFVFAKDVKETKVADAKTPVLESVEMRNEPKIELAVDAGAGGLVTDAERFTLNGVATDSKGLRDVYVFVNEQKVFFETTRNNSGQIKFTTDFPLKAGNNMVVVVAREDQDFMSRRLLIIRRKPGHEIVQKVNR